MMRSDFSLIWLPAVPIPALAGGLVPDSRRRLVPEVLFSVETTLS